MINPSIPPVRSIETPGFKERHSLAVRIWHWIFFLAIAASLVTVLLNATVFKARNNIGMVQQQLQEKGISVSADQARGVAHEFSDKLWNIHKIIGYVLGGLLLVRILLEFIQPRDEKLRIKLRRALNFIPHSPKEKEGKRHYTWVKWGYVVFYFLILVMALTGLGLAFEDAPFLKVWQRSIRNVHSFNQYLLYGYMLLHIGGVIVADISDHPGLVSGMINGKERA